ncbi:MAG: P-II family nitrogen regulator [Gemmatimonadota bacterium]
MTTETPSRDLWLVVAMVQPFKVDVIVLTLARHPAYDGMTLTDCRGLPTIAGRGSAARGEEDEPQPRTRLELLVTGRVQAEAIADAIAHAAHTGRYGDGKVLILPVQESISIREFLPGVDAV